MHPEPRRAGSPRVTTRFTSSTAPTLKTESSPPTSAPSTQLLQRMPSGLTRAQEILNKHSHSGSRSHPADPFNRLLTLVTPLTAEWGTCSTGAIHGSGACKKKSCLRPGAKQNTCSKEPHEEPSIGSTAVTVNSLCGYLCECGMHEAATEFLAAVCQAAEDAKLFDMLPNLPPQDAHEPTGSTESRPTTASGSTCVTRPTTRVGWQVDNVDECSQSSGSLQGQCNDIRRRPTMRFTVADEEDGTGPVPTSLLNKSFKSFGVPGTSHHSGAAPSVLQVEFDSCTLSGEFSLYYTPPIIFKPLEVEFLMSELAMGDVSSSCLAMDACCANTRV